ncbi:MAG: alpha/beta hydrolase [Acinetobacter harbinensis]|uniref:alpha/beta fold hydrolase n=1 Tax=Acinetobacter harbinensis TaxID=1353941 RepID=UPI0005807876|nr:alpha/beta hydrolase [Acinetobacter harbinensis]KWQ05694.1 lipase [Acinetobacter harbinensis]MDD2939761.1 alpha/beta hydrolase [Acinetobacter harbinensis]
MIPSRSTLSRVLHTLGLALALTVPHVSHALNYKKVEAPLSLQNYLITERNAAGLRSKSIKIDDVNWSYSEGGSSDKPAVLLIHGLAGSRDNWNGVAHFLTPFYHVIIPDLPNTGDTQVADDFDLSIPNVTERLRRFVEALDVEDKLNIAGHSLGGSIATVYASQYPFDTQSLFLLNSAGIYKQAHTAYTKDPYFLKNLVVSKPGDLEEVLTQVMQNPPQLPLYFKKAQEKMLIAQSSQTRKMIDQLITLNHIYTPESFARLTRTIEAPTLILWGKQDKIINVEAASELQSLLKRAEPPIILNNVGHVPILEAEQQVALHYLPFLAKTQKLKNPVADKLIPLN